MSGHFCWRSASPAMLLAAVLVAGCVSVDVGAGKAPPIVNFVLNDARPAGAPPAIRGDHGVIALQALGTDPLTDSTAIVYSRRADERETYQLASWLERPPRRLVELAQQRLQGRGRFAAVVQLGQPVQSDWLLTLTVEEMVHDVSSTPGRARMVVSAQLFNRTLRSLVASQRFSAAPTVAEADAPAAVRAFSAAAADILDRLSAWVEDAASPRPPG